MKDGNETSQTERSAVDLQQIKLHGITTLRISDWLHQDLLIKAGLPVEPGEAGKNSACRMPVRKGVQL